MIDQALFMDTVREVSEIVRTSAGSLSREEILSYFSEMDLNEEQQKLVLAYVLTPREERESVEQEDSVEEADGDTEQVATKEEAEPEKESRVLQLYLEELDGLKKLNHQEVAVLYEQLKNGEKEAVGKLANAWLPQVVEIAKKLEPSQEILEDVIQDGNMSLFLHLSGLCGDRNAVNVQGQLLQVVTEAMQSTINEMTGESDGETAILGKVALVHGAQEYLSQQNRRQPTTAELAEYTKIGEDELERILSICSE